MNKNTLLIIIIILFVIIGGYFLFFQGREQTSEFKEQPPTAEEPIGEKAPAAIKEITVIGTDFSFNPSNITLKAGEKAKITFKNNGDTIHNFILEGLGLGTKTIPAGQTDVLEFFAPESGVYSFLCSVPGHRAAGMEGTLKVE